PRGQLVLIRPDGRLPGSVRRPARAAARPRIERNFLVAHAATIVRSTDSRSLINLPRILSSGKGCAMGGPIGRSAGWPVRWRRALVAAGLVGASAWLGMLRGAD